MQYCNPIDTPFARSENLSKEMSPKTPKEKRKITNVSPSFVWENHTNQVSSEGSKLHMGSGQAKSGANFLMDLVFLKTS